MSTRLVIGIVSVLIGLGWAHAQDSTPAPTPRQVVAAVVREAGSSIPAQADALARLAWPEVDGDPAVARQARSALLHYRGPGLAALRRSLREVRPDQQADVVAALIRTFLNIGRGSSADFTGGLHDAVWYGTREARLLAITQLGHFRFSPSLLTIIDAAHEDPVLVPVAVEALGEMGDPRARFFLERVLLEGDSETRPLAAVALARIGDTALLPLKSAIRSDDPRLRMVAVQALLPVATIDDVSTLHEYIYAHPDDDPATLEAVRLSANALEEQFAAQSAGEAASSN